MNKTVSKEETVKLDIGPLGAPTDRKHHKGSTDDKTFLRLSSSETVSNPDPQTPWRWSSLPLIFRWGSGSRNSLIVCKYPDLNFETWFLGFYTGSSSHLQFAHQLITDRKPSGYLKMEGCPFNTSFFSVMIILPSQTWTRMSLTRYPLLPQCLWLGYYSLIHSWAQRGAQLQP